MEGCINTFKVFSMCCQTAFQKASYSGWTGCSSVLNQSTRFVLTTECYPFDTVFAKSGEKHGFSLVLTTFLLRVPRLGCPSSPRAVSRDFPNTNVFILAAFLLPLPKLACLNYVLKWYQKRGSEIEHPPSSIGEWLGCAWHHNENTTVATASSLTSLLACKAGLPTDLILEEALDSDSTERPKEPLGEKANVHPSPFPSDPLPFMN